jgi:hypothetical protein
VIMKMSVGTKVKLDIWVEVVGVMGIACWRWESVFSGIRETNARILCIRIFIGTYYHTMTAQRI